MGKREGKGGEGGIAVQGERRGGGEKVMGGEANGGRSKWGRCECPL